MGKNVIVEIETNGTIHPSLEMLDAVDQFNVSPKLTNSGESAKKRINELALRTFSRRESSIFKFVVTKEEDILEILQDYGEHIDLEKVFLMPAGETQEKLNEVRLTVIELCKKYGFWYSERLHIVAWNQKTGV